MTVHSLTVGMHAKIEKVQSGLDMHAQDTLFLSRSSEAILSLTNRGGINDSKSDY